MSWQHRTLGRVGPLGRHRLRGKTWKHLYSPFERWDSLIGADVAGLRESWMQAGGQSWRHAELAVDSPTAALEVLSTHHRSHWMPAYAVDLLDPAALSARSLVTGRWNVCSTRGVFVALTSEGQSWQIVTVFRPHPGGRGVDWTSEDFFAYGRDYWERKTNMNSTLASELLNATATVNTVDKARRLALLVGRARWSTDPAVLAALPAADIALSNIEKSLRVAIVTNGLPVLNEIEHAIRAEDVDDAAVALMTLEDEIAVATALGRDTDAGAWASEAAQMLEFCPGDWTALLPLAASRSRQLGGNLALPWDAAASAIAGAVAREPTPAIRPESTLLDSVLPPPPWIGVAEPAVSTAFAALGGRLTFANNTAYAEPRMAMGKASQEAWRVRLSEDLPRSNHSRLFVLDLNHPDGHCADAQLRDPAAWVWELDRPGDEAVLVFVSASSPVVGGTLAHALRSAAGLGDAVITITRITRSS